LHLAYFAHGSLLHLITGSCEPSIARAARKKTPLPEKIRAGIAVSIRTAALLRRRFYEPARAGVASGNYVRASVAPNGRCSDCLE
jgi:hypothetical protein